MFSREPASAEPTAQTRAHEEDRIATEIVLAPPCAVHALNCLEHRLGALGFV